MIDRKRLVKYLTLLLVVSSSTFFIPNCSIINEHAFYIGLLAASTFANLDECMPQLNIVNKEEEKLK